MFQKKFVQKINTHILRSIMSSENRAIYEALWKNMTQPDIHITRPLLYDHVRPQTQIQNKNNAFPWQKWLHESVIMLHLYLHCLSCLI